MHISRRNYQSRFLILYEVRYLSDDRCHYRLTHCHGLHDPYGKVRRDGRINIEVSERHEFLPVYSSQDPHMLANTEALHLRLKFLLERPPPTDEEIRIRMLFKHLRCRFDKMFVTLVNNKPTDGHHYQRVRLDAEFGEHLLSRAPLPFV